MGTPDWSPFDIKLMLHCYACLDKFPQSHAPIYTERLGALMDLGLVEYIEGIPRATRLGEAFVELLLCTPIPEVRYVDPRFPK